MKVFDKIFLALLLVTLMLVCVFVAVLEMGLVPNINPLSAVLRLDMPSWTSVLIVCAGAAILFVVAFRLFIAAFFLSSSKNEEVKKTTIVANDLGVAYITVDALKAIAKRHCLSFKFVHDCVASISLVNDGVIVSVKVVPYAEVNLPQSVASLQTSLREALEAQAGIHVIEVHVLIMPQMAKKSGII